MSTPYEDALLERMCDALSQVTDGERQDAERVVAICRGLATRDRDNRSKLQAQEGDRGLRIELNRLAELLGRRSSATVPFAALARAALADLGGDPAACGAGLGDAAARLSMRGL